MRFKIACCFLSLWFITVTVFAADTPSILLITIDTLRADHLGCYGYPGKTSPNIDAIAAQAVRFANAYTPAPITLPAHASILSGLYPANHGMRDNAHFPILKKQMLQQLLEAKGYQTAAFVSGAPLAADFGLSDGFDLYDDEFTGAERRADETTERVLRWIASAKQPYFLWIHYFDPHAEYDPPSAFRRDSPYDGEIAFVDAQIGKLMRALDSKTVLIITADHGESLGEHGEKTHGVFLYNATLRVPLIVRAPGLKPSVVNEAATLCDIAPTILEIAATKPAGMDGTSLISKLQPRTLLAESLYAQRNFGYAPLYAAIRDARKYIQAPVPEFYDLQKDPKEAMNLGFPAVPTAFKNTIAQYARPAAPSTPMSSEEAERLESLGYIGGGSNSSGNIDPKSKIDTIEQMNAAIGLLKLERYSEAEKAFQDFTSREKQSCQAFRFLGDAQAAQGYYEKAIAAYRSSYECLPAPAVALQLARALSKTKQFAEAESILRQTMEKFPDFVETRFELASYLASGKQWDEAFGLLNQDRPEFHNQKGILLLLQPSPAEAMVEFQKAIRQKQKAEYWNNVALAHQQLNQPEDAEKAYLQALQLRPDYEQSEANLSFLLIQQQRWAEAESHLMRITARNPRLFGARFALGIAIDNQNRHEEAQSIYRKLLEDAPADWPQRTQVQSRLRCFTN